MSHFSVGVIVKTTDEDGVERLWDEIESEVERLLAPFDEEIRVAPYRQECYCVGREAKSAGRKAAEERVMPLEELRKQFYASAEYLAFPEERRKAWEDEEISKAWKNFIMPYEAVQEYVEHNHPMYKKPKADCEECHGSGLSITRYNPNAHWDWYEIGGRWDGSMYQDVTGLELKEIENKNLRPVSDFVKRWDAGDKYTFFALVDPDGFWHEKGEMGWWGMVSNEKEKDTWQSMSVEMYRKYAEGHVVVMVDCHI